MIYGFMTTILIRLLRCIIRLLIFRFKYWIRIWNITEWDEFIRFINKCSKITIWFPNLISTIFSFVNKIFFIFQLLIIIINQCVQLGLWSCFRWFPIFIILFLIIIFFYRLFYIFCWHLFPWIRSSIWWILRTSRSNNWFLILTCPSFFFLFNWLCW